MNEEELEKIREIKKILNKAIKDFRPVKLIEIKEGVTWIPLSKLKERKRIEHNFFVYAMALEKIYSLLNKNEEKV